MWDMTGLYTFLTLFLSLSVLNMHSFVSFDYLGHHNTLRDRRWIIWEGTSHCDTQHLCVLEFIN